MAEATDVYQVQVAQYVTRARNAWAPIGASIGTRREAMQWRREFLNRNPHADPAELRVRKVRPNG